MTDTDDLRNGHDPRMPIHLSETEVFQLFEKAAQQYEEYMRLAELADISDQLEISVPRYAWDNPIGLVVTGPSNAWFVSGRNR